MGSGNDINDNNTNSEGQGQYNDERYNHLKNQEKEALKLINETIEDEENFDVHHLGTECDSNTNLFTLRKDNKGNKPQIGNNVTAPSPTDPKKILLFKSKRKQVASTKGNGKKGNNNYKKITD